MELIVGGKEGFQILRVAKQIAIHEGSNEASIKTSAAGLKTAELQNCKIGLYISAHFLDGSFRVTGPSG